MTSGTSYPWVSDPDELERLNRQGAVLAPATRVILQMAGIRPAMRVLDLGSGTGDTALAAAELVGAAGEVIGIDHSPEAIATARARAEEHEFGNVTFVEGEIGEPAPGGPFDAITARFVLRFVPDPAAVLRIQGATLRPGGVAVPIEFNIATAASVPESPLVTQAFAWLTEAFNIARIDLTLGPRLRSVLQAAGLRPTGMIGIQPYLAPEDPDAAALIAGIVRTSLPLLERTGVATAGEIHPQTLQARLASELAARDSVFAYPTLIGAWGMTP